MKWQDTAMFSSYISMHFAPAGAGAVTPTKPAAKKTTAKKQPTKTTP